MHLFRNTDINNSILDII